MEIATVTLPVHIFEAAISKEGFFMRVQKLAEDTDTMSQAYEMAEQEQESEGLSRRYNSYLSFKVAYNRWVKATLET